MPHGQSEAVAGNVTRSALPERPKILVVDDNPSALEQVVNLLQGFDAIIVFARDGKEAYGEVLRTTTPFSLIISDIDMSPQNGFELLANLRLEIKSKPWIQETPVIIVSSNDDLERMTRAIKLGAAAFFNKADLRKDPMFTILVQEIISTHRPT